YPQRAFPYAELVDENRRRDRTVPEYELPDTGILDGDRFFDLVVEYAKADVDDIVIRISATNRGPDAAPLHVLPTLWFRNTWSWGADPARPSLRQVAPGVVAAIHPDMGTYLLACDGTPDLLFTENESNAARLWHVPNRTPYVKDGVNDAIVNG